MAPTTPSIDIEAKIGQYVKLRDVIKGIEEDQKKFLEEYKSALETLGNQLLAHMQGANVESVKAGTGTAYISTRNSVSLQDPDAFMDYVIANKAYDLIDRKANATAVADFIEKNGSLPPGTKYTQMIKVGVRRSNDKEE